MAAKNVNAQEAPSPASNWIIPLRAAAIVMGVFGVSCLAVLVVVTAIDEKSALATVALALAILAFSVQLIVFVAQQSFVSEQGRRNEELYGSMQGVLAEIKEKAAGTQEEVRSMRETILPALLSKSRADPAGGQMDSVVSQLLGVQPQVRLGVVPAAEQWPERRPAPDDESIVQRLKTYPQEGEIGSSLTLLEGLTPAERMNLKAFGDDEIITRQPDSPFDPALTELAAGGLLEKGLVEPYPQDRQSRPDNLTLMRLTDCGRDVARLLTASEEPPEYLEGLKQIREETPDRLPGYQAQRGQV